MKEKKNKRTTTETARFVLECLKEAVEDASANIDALKVGLN